MKKIIVFFLLSVIGVGWYLLFINPYSLAPLQFVPIIGVVYILSALSIYMIVWYFSKLTQKPRAVASCIIAFSPTIIFALMTLGTLSAIDVVLAVLVPVIIAWYSISLNQKQ